MLLASDGASAVGRSERGPGTNLTNVRRLWHLDGVRAFRATPANWSPDQHELIDWLHCIEWQTVLSCTCLSVHCLGFNRGLIWIWRVVLRSLPPRILEKWVIFYIYFRFKPKKPYTRGKTCLVQVSTVWRLLQGPAEWVGKYYKYRAKVYSPWSRKVEVLEATDPYSRSLAADGARTQVRGHKTNIFLFQSNVDVVKPKCL